MSTQTQEEWDRLHGSQYDAEEFTGWKVLESKVPGYERVISVVADGNLGVCRMDGGGSSNPKVLEDVRAKARLIAASPALYEACKAGVEEIQICPNCNNVGYYADGPTDDPEQTQCEFCYTVPNSLFNLKEKCRAALGLAKKGDDEDDEEPSSSIRCSRCGKPTTWDSVYNDLCYRCIRASNE